MGKKDNFFSSSRGQAVIELALFGAILIFVIASIVQQGVGAAFSQNQTLQATRQALLKSYQTGRGAAPLPPDKTPHKSAARNSSSFIFIEDRLSPGVTRYGVADRQPIVSMGSGTLSNKLFWVSDWDDLDRDAPLFDLRVNGLSFMLKSAVPLVYRVKYNTTDVPHTFSVMRVKQSPFEVLFRQLAPLFKDGESLSKDAAEKRKKVEEKLRYLLCSKATTPIVMGQEVAAPGDVNPPVPLGDPKPRMERDAESTGINDYTLFSIVVKNDPKFNSYGSGAPHYDLRRDGNSVPLTSQGNFIYKWNWKPANDVMKEVDWETANFPSYDVDGDLKEEMVYHITKYVHSTDWTGSGPDTGDPGGNPRTSGPAGWDVCQDTNPASPTFGKSFKIYDVAVMDFTAGETVSAGTETNPDDEPGLKQATDVYTVVQDGTTLEIREGQAMVGSQQLTTSFSTKRQFDVISREYQLNQNMVTDNTIYDDGYDGFSEDPGFNELVRCSDGSKDDGSCCATPGNMYVTCFDKDSKRLYIRSRIDDRRGRMWVTKQ